MLHGTRTFGAEIRNKLQSCAFSKHMAPITVPGNIPYKMPEKLIMIKQLRETITLTPETDLGLCAECHLCSIICPTEAISLDDPTKTDRWKCILCFACVKRCPTGARQMRDNDFLEKIQRLARRCVERREPEIYL